MISKFSSLCLSNIFFVSRQKILLKRRKASSKKKKVAKKKFLQDNPNRSYTNQLKILQIQKQLDKKVNRNQHLNQLMDQLFYPDVRYTHEKIMQQQLLKISTSNTKSNNNNKQLKKLQKSQNIQDLQIHTSKLQGQQQQYDQLLQQIYVCQIPSQFFQLYLQNSQYFTHEHIMIMLNRLRYYFKNKPKIQQFIINKWKRSLDKVKLTSDDQKKRKKCPYIFLDKEDLIRDDNWNKVVKSIKMKIQQSIVDQNNHKEQQKNQKEDTNNIETDIYQDESFVSLENNSDLLLNILSVAGYIPQDLFNLIIHKAFKIVQSNKGQKKSRDQNLSFFTHSQKVKLIRLLSQKNQTKSTLTQSLHIDSPQNTKVLQQNIMSFAKKLSIDIITSQKCSSQDLGAVIRSRKGYFKFVNSHILQNSKPKILKFITSTNLQRSIDYLYSFWLNGTSRDIQFIQILKYDIYRKLPHSLSKHHLFTLLFMINQGHITFKQTKISFSFQQIYPRIVEIISQKYLSKGLLNHQQIKKYLNSIYMNYSLILANSNSIQNNLRNLIQIVSTQVVKISQGFKLQQITQIYLKTTILSNRSKILSKFILKRFTSQYKKLMKRYKQQKVSLIQDKSTKNNQTDQQITSNNLPSMNEIKLQQNLIMFLWSFMFTYKQHQSQLPLNDLIQIYPLKIISQDIMILDMINDLNRQLKQYHFFPIIKSGTITKKIIKKQQQEEYQQINDEQQQQKQGQHNKIKTSKRLRKPIKQKQIVINPLQMVLLRTNTYTKFSYDYSNQLGFGQIIDYLQKNIQNINKSPKLYQLLIDLCIRYCSHSQNKQNNKNILNIPNRWTDSTKLILKENIKKYQEMRYNFYEMNKQQFQNITKQQKTTNIKHRVIKIVENTFINNKNFILKEESNIASIKDTLINKKIYDLL